MARPKNKTQDATIEAQKPAQIVATTPKQDSPLQIALNKHIIGYLQTNKARFLLGENFVEISLASRKAEQNEKRQDIIAAAQVQLKSGESVSLENLPDNAAIAYKVRIIRTNLQTTFTHAALSAHNQTMFEKEDTFLAWFDGDKCTLERDEFLGEKLSAGKIAGLIRITNKNGKTQKSVQKWRKVKGIYQIL